MTFVDHGLSCALLLSLPHNLTVSQPYSPDISLNYFHHPDPSLQPRSSTTMPFYDIRHSIPLTRVQRDDLAAKITHDAVTLREHPAHTHRPRGVEIPRRFSTSAGNPQPSPPIPPSLYHPSSKFPFMASSVIIRVSVLALPPIPRRSQTTYSRISARATSTQTSLRSRARWRYTTRSARALPGSGTMPCARPAAYGGV